MVGSHVMSHFHCFLSYKNYALFVILNQNILSGLSHPHRGQLLGDDDREVHHVLDLPLLRLHHHSATKEISTNG